MHTSRNVRYSDVGKIRRFTPTALAVLMLLIGTSCGSAPPSTAQRLDTAALQTEIERVMKANVIPGAIVLIKSRDKGDWRATLGTGEIGKTAPLSMADAVRIGSNT